MNKDNHLTTTNVILKAYFILIFGILCNGFSAIFVKLAGVPGPVATFYRTITAGLIIIPYWAYKTKHYPLLKDTITTLIGGALFALTITLWNTSILHIPVTTATLLINSAPLWVGLASFLLFHEKLSKNYWIGSAVAMLGMLWLLGSEAYTQLHISYSNILALLSSITYAAYLLITQTARKRVTLLSFMAISLIGGIIILLPLNLAIGTNLIGYSKLTWFALICLGIVSQLGGWISINYALGHIHAARVSVCLLGESVVATIMAMPLLHEFLKINQFIGGIIILTGIYLVIKTK